ncbi:GNAT family N-acetyltransferase [Isoptericola aurantiacus]|uniref:GNAT family N-acetyltransferase n=1 Tax=Isoptericola aurantiacus TaxID=3377839 RepID=UPI00383B64A6
MTVEIRPLSSDDAPTAQRLAEEAFGTPARPTPPPTPQTWPPANAHPWGAWVDGELVAKATVRSFTSWFHGARVPTAGIGGVTVAAEHRGSGLLRPLLDAALAEARERGEVVSTLFPSAAGIYRGLGYEIVGAFDEVSIPMSALAAVRRPAGLRTRRATPTDAPALREVYTAWARGQNGPLTRTEAPFDLGADDVAGPDADYTGVSLAVDPAGEVQGFASWRRGTGYDRSTGIEVEDLVALTPDAARALWAVLGSFATVTGSVRLCTSGGWSGADPSRLVLPDHATSLVQNQPYMLRLLDLPGALGAARQAPLSARVPFAVVDATAPDLAGSWTLEVAGTGTRVVPDDGGPAARPTFTSAGLALSYAGAQSCANLRLAGHLSGPDAHDAVWDAVWAGRQVHVRDHF